MSRITTNDKDCFILCDQKQGWAKVECHVESDDGKLRVWVNAAELNAHQCDSLATWLKAAAHQLRVAKEPSE